MTPFIKLQVLTRPHCEKEIPEKQVSYLFGHKLEMILELHEVGLIQPEQARGKCQTVTHHLPASAPNSQRTHQHHVCCHFLAPPSFYSSVRARTKLNIAEHN